jgi:hypothetical protein
MRTGLLRLALLPAWVFSAGSARAQERPAEILLVGTFHFHNPGRDVAQFRVSDVLSPEGQVEVMNVVESLARFRPTKVAVEQVRATRGDSLREQYRRYRNGAFVLTSNEMHQLGFRIAERFAHDSVYPVDFAQGMEISKVMAYAAQHDTAFSGRLTEMIGSATRTMNEWHRTRTLTQILRSMNSEPYLRAAEAPYMEMAGVGAGDGWVGATVVAGWYERNLKIFANLVQIAEPGDRILFVVGQGHAPILRHLISNHPRLRLVEALDYLREPSGDSGAADRRDTP